MKRTVLICAVALVVHTLSASAADRPLVGAVPIVAPMAAAALEVAAPEIVAAAPSIVLSTSVGAPPKRSPMLLAMYATVGLVQAYDGYTTIKGVAANQVELNPAMLPFVKHPSLVIAAKGAMTLATIAAAENLWRHHHRGQAIAMLIVSNGLMAAVGAHNAMVLRGAR